MKSYSLTELYEKYKNDGDVYIKVTFTNDFLSKYEKMIGWKGCGGKTLPTSFYYRGEYFYYGGSMHFERYYKSADEWLTIPLSIKEKDNVMFKVECIIIY